MAMNSSKLYIVKVIFGLLPETKLFKLKSKFYKWCRVALGDNGRITSFVIILGIGSLCIGSNTWIDYN